MEIAKYLILGNGYIGNKLNGFLDDSVLSDVRIKKIEDVKKEIEKHNPEFVINAIGKTGRPNIDWCETNKEETFFSNVVVPAMIAEVCHDIKKRMVHIGSGCIFSGDNDGRGFSEDDAPNFNGSFYARTKIMSENLLKGYDVLQLRIRLPFDGMRDERNLITKLLRYDKILDVPNSVTYCKDFLIAAKKLMDIKATGIFNIVNPGVESHKDLLDLYNSYSNAKKDFKLISEKELSKLVKAGRSNCVLSTKKIESLGIKMLSVENALKESVRRYVEG